MEISTQFLILVPVILGVVEAIKKAGMRSRFAPILSVVLGIAGAFWMTWFEFGSMDMFQGIIAGLVASGLWSGVKKTILN
jgi:hypothetical protein